LKYTFITFSALIGLIILLVALAVGISQTSFFKKKLPAIVQKQASNYINGTLTIGSVGGNFFTGIAIENILLTNDSDTIASIAQIKADYDLLPLLRGKLEISSAHIAQPYVYAKQINDSTWNLQQIVKPLGTATDDSTSTDSSTFEINLSKLTIVDGNIRVDSPDSIIPQRIIDLNTELSLQYSSKTQEINLKQFNFQTQTPDVVLQQLSFQLTRNAQNIELRDFYLKTAQNQIEGDGEYNPGPRLEANVNLKSAPIHINEFEYFIPDLKLPVTPIFNFGAQARNDSLLAEFELVDGEETVYIDLGLANFPAVIYNLTDSMIRYRIEGTVNNISLEKWSGMPDLDYILNGDFTAEGVGIQPETAVAQLTGDFRNSVIEQRPIARLDFAFDIDRGKGNGNATASGDFGKVEIYPEINDFMGERPSYQIRMLAEKLNLAKLTGKDTLQSDLNLTADISGSGFDPKTLSVRGKIEFSASQLAGIQIDTLYADASFSNQNAQIDSLLLRTQSLYARAKGNYSLISKSDLVFGAQIQSLDEFRRFVPLEGAQTSGNINARLWGMADSINIDAMMALSETEFDSIYADTIVINANALMAKNDTLINATLAVSNVWNTSFQLDSITAEISASLDSAFVTGRVSNHDLTTYLSTGINWAGDLKVRLEEWQIQYKDQKWELENPPAKFEMDSVNYQLENFALMQNHTDSTARIAANGIFSMVGKEDFKVELTNIDIAQMAKTFYKEIDATGKLNLSANLQGTAISPELTGNFEIEDPMFNTYKIDELGGEVDYRSDVLKFTSKIVPKDSGRIELTGELPLLLRFDSISYEMRPTDPINAKLTVDRFPLSIVQAMEFTENIEGYLEGSVTVDGTVENPNPEGSLQLQNAALEMPNYGIEYKQIDMKVEFMSDKVDLDTFRIVTDDGQMTASGQMDFNSVLYKGDISKTNIEVKFDSFNPVNHKQLNMEVNGHASLSGNKNKVVFDGDLEIPEADIYLPFVMNLMGIFNTPEMPKPILLQELQKSGQWTDTTLIARSVESPNMPDSIGSNYFENFTGTLNIKIPKNTWVKNEDFRIELSGDLELRKNLEFFEIFGTVDVVRGQYDLFGKTFVIETGTVTFQGGEEIQPELNITANYTFRNSQRAEQELSVNITGTATSPKIDFTLDGSSIDEGDALSYILFGKGLNELTLSQQDNISGGGGSMAESAVTSLLSSQITKFLGDKLNVDYIEVKSDGTFDNATVTVGKYITNDLFVNYEQMFGESTRLDQDRYRVELEYELFKFLFFQLNNSSSDSGFNVIFKFDSK
jgi:translocation and assembly module TamB